MPLNLLDRIGEINPQLFRELKGRLKVRNVAIALATSLLGQLVFVLYWLGQLPGKDTYIDNPYCRLRDTYLLSQRPLFKLQNEYYHLEGELSRYSEPKHFDPEKVQQLKGSLQALKGKIEALPESPLSNCPPDAIDYQRWWHEQYPNIFASFSVIVMFVMFALLVVGTYMLISDLTREQRRGTLNFIRLSPQTTLSILLGKMLGVPILLYLAVLLIVPLHLWLGLSVQLPLVRIFCFYAVVVASCAFFYSGALLFGLVSSWFSGFQSWLGSGAVLAFLWLVRNRSIDHTPTDWLNLFCPSVALPYVYAITYREYYRYRDFSFSGTSIYEWEWFDLPLGESEVCVFIFVLLNYGIGTYWIWQALNRRFHNPDATLVSKQQSYLLSACVAVVSLGFAVHSPTARYSSFDNFTFLLSLNLLLLVSLIAVLSPHRQDLQDWARYRRERGSALIKDLLWGEKSPVVVAIAINLAITSVPMAVWVLFWPLAPEGDRKMEALLGLVVILSLIAIYATLTQLMLLMKTNKRAIWAAGTVVAANLLPPSILMLLSLYPYSAGKWAGLWLFTTAPWDALKYVSAMLVIQALLVQWSILGLLNWQLTRQLRRIGESESKDLFAGHP